MALSELEVVERFEVEVGTLADLPQRDVVLLGLAVGGLGLRDVRQGGQQPVPALVELVQLWLELLERGLERA